MPITLNQFTQPNSFESSHHMQFPIPGNRSVVVMSGVAVIHVQPPATQGRSFFRDRLNLKLRFPVGGEAGSSFIVQEVVPFVTLNAIGSGEAPRSSGGGNTGGQAIVPAATPTDAAAWAVDGFSVAPGNVETNAGAPMITLQADIAIRDVDSVLFRVGYHLTVVGVAQLVIG